MAHLELVLEEGEKPPPKIFCSPTNCFYLGLALGSFPTVMIVLAFLLFF